MSGTDWEYLSGKSYCPKGHGLLLLHVDAHGQDHVKATEFMPFGSFMQANTEDLFTKDTLHGTSLNRHTATCGEKLASAMFLRFLHCLDLSILPDLIKFGQNENMLGSACYTTVRSFSERSGSEKKTMKQH